MRYHSEHAHYAHSGGNQASNRNVLNLQYVIVGCVPGTRLDGVQGVGGSNPLAPTKTENEKGTCIASAFSLLWRL